MSDVLRIGNCSGFYGDRLSAMREMLEGSAGGHGLDVLTGDYLAELTMLILGKDTLKDASLGYARTFVRQAEDCLGLALERGVRIVANAGGLNPAGLAARLREVAGGLGLDVDVAHVEGDDLRPRAAELGLEGALTANAYLGGHGIAEALRAGADVVVTGRVTDASLVLGPAVAHFGWAVDDWDALAGAVVAGHVLECGTQATGGNFSGFATLPRRDRPLGFPVAEVAADGSCVVTKHDGTGGAVTVDTVTAQLMYEIQSARYLGPDVTVLLDSVRLAPDGPDRVRVSGVRGEAPPERLKVCVNELGGFRNTVELVLTGLDLDAKAAWVREQVEAAWGDRAPADVTWSLSPVRESADAGTEEGASRLLRCTVRDPSPEVAGKGLTAPVVELALASYPGFTLTGPPSPATPYGVYRATYVDRAEVEHVVSHTDGHKSRIADPPTLGSGDATGLGPSVYDETASQHAGEPGPTRRVPLGTFVHARSGDKGGDANLGLWVGRAGSLPGPADGPGTAADRDDGDGRDDQDDGDDRGDRRAARVAWLLGYVTPERVRALVPEAADLEVEVHPLPNLGGVNVLLRGLLGEGVAASTRFDPQAKGLGEWVRARTVEIPEELL